MKAEFKRTDGKQICSAIGCAKVIRKGVMCKRHWQKLDRATQEEVALLWTPEDRMATYEEANAYFMACIHAVGVIGLIEGRIDFAGLQVLMREAERRFEKEHGHLREVG